MKNIKKKGFTLVELVIVIAVIAILAGVLIGTFASVIKRANQSAEVQNIKNAEIAQKADDILKKIEDSNWFGWEDFETSIVAKITTEIKNSSTNTLSATEVEKIVKDALSTWEAQGSQTTDLTADQVKAIVENAIGTLKYEGVTEAQVRAIVNAATATTIGNSLSAAQVKAIVIAANENNLTAAQVAAVLVDKLSSVSTTQGLEEKATEIKNALSNSVTVLSGEIDELKNTINALSSADQDNVLFAKRLNVQVGKQGLNSSNVDTPYDVIKVLGEMDLATQTTGSKILFSLDDVRFFVVSDTNDVLYDGGLTYVASNNYRYWVFVDAYGTDLEYSQYLLGTGVTGPIDEVDTGLDVGKNTGITTINFDSTTSNPLVIRTNGGTLTIYAPNADIYHYGYAEKIDVIDVKATSLHVNGDVDLIKVKKGHVELESDAQVLGIYVYNDSTDTQKDDSFENIKITVKVGAEVPQLSRSAVEIDPTNGTKVCTLVTDEAKDIYLFQQGVYEQIKTVDEGKNVTNDTSASWADDDTKNNDRTQTAAQQLANELNASFEVGETTYTAEVVNREVVVTNTTTNETVTDTTVVTKAVDQSGKDETQAVSELGLFGKGTKDDPFLIYDYATMQKISNYYNEGSFYFEVALDKTNNGTIDCTNWKSVNLKGSFDGKNVKFINLDNKLFNYTYKATVSNFTVENPYIVKNGFTAVVSNYAYYVTYENITINGGYVQGSNSAASFVGLGWGTYPNSFEFKNCTSSATLASQATSVGGFIAHPYSNISGKNAFSDGVDPIRIVIDNSSFTGVMQAASGSHYAYVYGNGDNACLVEIKNSDTSLFTGYTGAFNSYTTYQEIHYADSTKKSSMPNVTATKNDNDTFSVNAVSSAIYAKAILIISPNDTTDRYGSYSGTYMEEDLSLNDGKFTTSTIKAFSITINDSNVSSTTGLFDGTFNVVNSYYGHTHNGAVVRIIQYNELGNIVAISNYTIAESTTLH